MKDFQQDLEVKTRARLAYFWSGVSAVILCYIVVMWGHKMEILTLIIGLVGGTVIGGIYGTYFGSSLTKKIEPNPQATVTGDSPQVTVNPPAEVIVKEEKDE